MNEHNGLRVAQVDLDLRGYQEELAREGCAGENVIILAPTNSGKTRVACRIIEVYFAELCNVAKNACLGTFNSCRAIKRKK